MSFVPSIVITIGEPSGIGVDLVIELSHFDWQIELIVVGDVDVILSRAQLLNQKVDIVLFDGKCKLHKKGQLCVLPIQFPHRVIAGELNYHNSAMVIEGLTIATQLCLSKRCHALVTGPMHKGVINKAGIPFQGHTEFLCALAEVEQVVMMLSTKGLNVALASTHIPLSQVCSFITQKNLAVILNILHKELQRYLGKVPSIYVCGLNPHAGEDGHLGMEEIEVIIPVLERLRQQGLDVIGPLPADTIFQAHYMQHADVILAMYHDQGLPVLKYKGFHQAYNITLGLPFIRTSVDHGTALDLVGKNEASVNSFCLALEKAILFSANHHK